MFFYTFVLLGAYFEVVEVLDIRQMLNGKLKYSTVVLKLITSNIKEQQMHLLYFEKLF